MPSDGHSPIEAPTLPPPPEGPIAGLCLFLDFDGTLVEIAERHDAVRVDPGLRDLLPVLARRLEGRLAIVSGRTVDELIKWLGPIAGAAMAGSHGLEMLWPDGRRTVPEAPPSLAETIAEVEAFAEAMPGVLVEPKPFGVTVHYRQAPHAAGTVAALTGRLAEKGEFALQHGKMISELRAHGADKGDAVAAMMAVPPMAGGWPCFIGDDLTDEAGFRAAQAAGGAGILVGSRPGTAATYRLPDVTAVHAWLATIAESVPA